MIIFSMRSRVPPPLRPSVVLRIGRVLNRAICTHGRREVGVRFVAPAEIRRLNRLYRRINRPTDVLSFSSVPPPGTSEREMPLGDVVICPSYARREAKRRGIDVEEELVRLLVHGVLHLAGHDHATKKDERAMFALQERCVESVRRL